MRAKTVPPLLRLVSICAALVCLLFGFEEVRAQTPPFAWQTEGAYQAPNFEGTFPADSEAAKRLKAEWPLLQHEKELTAERLELVRRGFRGLPPDLQTIVLRWLGNAFIWNQPSQDPRAIDLMYHAAGSKNPSVQNHAIYFGLSVVRPLTGPILRTLAEAAMDSRDPNLLSRVAWGAAAKKERLISYLAPFLESSDSETREHAEVLRRVFSGELEAFAWAKEQARLRAEASYSDQLPEIRRRMADGPSALRLETLQLIQRERLALIMDDSFILTFQAAADDPEAKVRSLLATIAGERWIWGADPQTPEAIQLMVRLSRDPDRGVRYGAMYYGLSTIRNRTAEVAERMLELTLRDGLGDSNFRHRITWGFRNDRELLAEVLQGWMRAADSKRIKALFARGFYHAFFEEEPPATPALEPLLADPEQSAGILIAIGMKEGWEIRSMEQVLDLLLQELPAPLKESVYWPSNQGPPFLLLELDQAPQTRQVLAASPHFKAEIERPLTAAHILRMGREGRLELTE